MRLFFIVLVISFSFFNKNYNVIDKEIIDQDYQDEVLRTWISIIENAYSFPDSSHNRISTFNIASEDFFDLYKKSGDTIYLNFALNEADSEQRNQIISELSNYEKIKVTQIIQKLENYILPDNYFDLSPFNVEDIYHFYNINIPKEHEEKARQLLDYWSISLPQEYVTDDLLTIFKIQSLVSGYYLLRDHQKVYELGKHLIENETFPASHFTIDFFLILDFSARSLGYFESSLRIHQKKLLPFIDLLDEKNTQALIRMNYAMILFRIGNFAEALKEFEDLYSNFEYVTYQDYKAAIFNNLAIIYLNTGRFNQYLDFQLNALRIAEEDNNYNQQIAILRNLYIFHQRQNETELAFNYLERALQLAYEKNITEELAPLLISLGIYNRTVEDHPVRGLDFFYEALRHADMYSNYRQIFNSYYEIAISYLMLEDFATAEKYIRDNIKLSQSRNDNRGYIQSNILLANIYLNSGKLAEADSVLAQFTNTDFQLLAFDARVLAHNLSIKIQMEYGNYLDAYSVSTEIMTEVIDWLRESSNQETGHMRMDEEFSEAFRLHLDLSYRVNRPEEALYTIGNLRSISRSGFYNNPLLKSQILTQEELIQEYQLGEKIRQLRGQYAMATAGQKVTVSNELIAVMSQRNNLLNSAFRTTPDTPYINLLRQLQRELRSDQMVFYIAVFDGQFFRFTITRENVGMKVYPKDDYYQEIIQKATSAVSNGNTNLNYLYEVYSAFFEGQIPEKINHIYFIPDGRFYMLPLSILPLTVPDSADGYNTATYFVERYSVSYANTLSDIVKKRGDQNNNFQYDMAGFGISNFSAAGHPDLASLPFGPHEIVRSAEALNRFNRKRIYLENESTKENFSEVAGKSRILHIATHSRVDNNNPLFSALYMHNGLSQKPEENMLLSDNLTGVLYAHELFHMNLNADLIFLSSCESGTGSYLQGSGILGFSRAFSYAGAQSLSLNLWPVSDRTASEIAIRFYEALNMGINKANALRDAQISYLKNNNADPFYWGAFVLYANIDPVISAKHKYEMVYYLFIPILIALAFTYRFFRSQLYKLSSAN
jgi:CHAT domain-containing protein